MRPGQIDLYVVNCDPEDEIESTGGTATTDDGVIHDFGDDNGGEQEEE